MSIIPLKSGSKLKHCPVPTLLQVSLNIFSQTWEKVDITKENYIVVLFNKHFVSTGCVFNESKSGSHCSNSSTVRPWVGSWEASFVFRPILKEDIYIALKAIDPKKSPGPDNLGPFLLKVAAGIIAKPIAYIFNCNLQKNSITKLFYILQILTINVQFPSSLFLLKCWKLKYTDNWNNFCQITTF